MNKHSIHDIYNLATRLPGSWLNTKSFLDSYVDHASLQNADKAAMRALLKLYYKELPRTHEKELKDPVYSRLIDEMADLAQEFKNRYGSEYDKDAIMAGSYGDEDDRDVSGIDNPAGKLVRITKEDKDGNGYTDYEKVESYW